MQDRTRSITKSNAKMIDHSLLHPTLTDQDMTRGCEVGKRYGVAAVVVKSYAVRMAAEILKGAREADLRLMRENCSESVQVKAAGKVRTLNDVLRVRSPGVTRIGTTATEAILTEAEKRGLK